MGSERLLTPTERDNIHRQMLKEIMAKDKSLGFAEAMVKAVESDETKNKELEDQDAKTLKAVGEWYEGYLRSFGVLDDMIKQNTAITALKQGKMPEQ